MIFYLIHKYNYINEILSFLYVKFYAFIFLANKIISFDHFDHPKLFPKLFRLWDFNFDFKYTLIKCNTV